MSTTPSPDNTKDFSAKKIKRVAGQKTVKTKQRLSETHENKSSEKSSRANAIRGFRRSRRTTLLVWPRQWCGGSGCDQQQRRRRGPHATRARSGDATEEGTVFLIYLVLLYKLIARSRLPAEWAQAQSNHRQRQSASLGVLRFDTFSTTHETGRALFSPKNFHYTNLFTSRLWCFMATEIGHDTFSRR